MQELQQGFQWAAQHFFPILSTEQQQVKLDFILQCARVAKIRHGIKVSHHASTPPGMQAYQAHVLSCASCSTTHQRCTSMATHLRTPTLRAVWLQGLIIDPYNELSSSTDNGSDGRMEHQRVNDLMAELRAFAKKQQVGLIGC